MFSVFGLPFIGFLQKADNDTALIDITYENIGDSFRSTCFLFANEIENFQSLVSDSI